MARRGRQTGMKALGPGHRHRNKNPKLSPYQRELKRGRLANQVPRPFVNASANHGGKKTPVTADSLNLSLMYQKRDTPAKARGLMKFLQDKEDRARERQEAKAEAERKRQEEEDEDANQTLQYRERNENSDHDDDDTDEEDIDSSYSAEEGDENGEETEEQDDDDESETDSNDELSDTADSEMEGMLADLEHNNDDGSDGEIIDDDDNSNKPSTAGNKMVLTKVPENPSGKQLKAWMVKRERLSYLAMKEKGDTAGCESLLKKVLIGQGFTFVDPKTLEKPKKAQKKAEDIKGSNKSSQQHKRQRGRPITEGELSAQLSNLNEEMEQQMAPNLAAASINNKSGTKDSHDALMAESALINLKLLKKKEKKHAKKSEKRRERTMEEINTIETEMNQAMSKKHKKKVLKEKMKEGDANYKLHQQLTNKQIENLKAGIGAKRQREEGDGHDPNFLLPFQVYEQQQQQKQVKRLSGMDESQLQRAIDLDDSKGKIVEKIQFGERAEAPPVFNVVPSMSNSFAKFAMKLQSDTTKKTPASAKNNNAKVNGVVTSNGGIRSQQNKPGKAKETALANKAILKNAMSRLRQQSNVAVNSFARNDNGGIISTAPRVDSTGDMSLYERKRLAKLGLMGPVTEQRVNRSSVANGGEGNSAHNASEMEMLRQRVMSTYQRNKKARKEGASSASQAPAAGTKSWMPTDRDY